MKKKLKILFIVLAFLGFFTPNYAQTIQRDYRLISKYVSMIPDYTIWPQDAMFGDFIIGVIGSHDITNYLRVATAGKAYLDQIILVKQYSSPEEMRDDLDELKMVFLPTGQETLIPEVLTVSKGYPLLIITNLEQGQKTNFMLDITMLNSQDIDIRINENLLGLKEIKISSKIYAIARKKDN